MFLVKRNKPVQSEKIERVVSAAQQIFIKYGYRRTTMGDLAEAGEISRPALYLLYANKEEIFRAVITRYYENAEKLAYKRIESSEDVEQQLKGVMQTWVVEPFIEINRSPEAGEIYEAGYAFADDLRDQFSQIYMKQVESVLHNSSLVHLKTVQQHGLSIRRVAEMMVHSTLGLKRELRDLEKLESLLADIRRWNLALLCS